MKNTTPLFPNFHLQTLRRTPRSARQILLAKAAQLKEKSLTELCECVGKFLPLHLLKNDSSGAMSRHRIYSKENTFWGFFSQVLDSDGSCQEIVRKIQAYAAIKGKKTISSSTSAYCQARQKLNLEMLESILFKIPSISSLANDESMHNRRVLVVDGTGISMPDTPDNQSVWPQSNSQKPGCGFPQARLCACFNLQTGLMHSYRVGNKKSAELPLFREQWETFKTGDIILGDKGFCSFYDMSNLSDRGVDTVITLGVRKPTPEHLAKRILGKDDYVVDWQKPATLSKSYPKTEWENLPETLTIRQIKVTVDQPGFRTKCFYIVTTLLDAKQYPVDVIADLYFKRWEVELFFRDIKTTMGMDILRCKTPEMIDKEIVMYLIAYNCIRCLMLSAADQHSIPVRRISFKSSIQAVRNWEPHFNRQKTTALEREQLIDFLYESMAKKIVPDRPGRREPRAVKRRPKPFQLLTKPRHEMMEIQHRSRYAKQA